jgi:hypothetical protein
MDPPAVVGCERLQRTDREEAGAIPARSRHCQRLLEIEA